MTKVTVTVELDIDATDVPILRTLARHKVEQTGLKVARVTVPKPKDPKPYTPKAWEPGLAITVKGVAYQIWSQAPGHKANSPDVFAVPVVHDPVGPPLVRITNTYLNGAVADPVNLAGGRWVKPTTSDFALVA